MSMPYPEDSVMHCIFYMLLALLLMLAATQLLHFPEGQDTWQRNQKRLDTKITIISVVVSVGTVILFLPSIITSTLEMYVSVDSYAHAMLGHKTFQLAVHHNSLLFWVLLQRQEFRRSLRLVWRPRSVISREHQPNLMFLAMDKNKAGREDENVFKQSRGDSVGSSGLRGRESDLDTTLPSWLQKKNSKKVWSHSAYH